MFSTASRVSSIERRIAKINEEIIALERLEALLYKKINEFDEKTSDFRHSITNMESDLQYGNLTYPQIKETKQNIADMKRKIKLIEKEMDINYDKLKATVKTIPQQVQNWENKIYSYQNEIRSININY